MLAPPWIPVPAPAYGGIEEVVRLLTRRPDRPRARRDAVRAAGLERRRPRSSPVLEDVAPGRHPEGPVRVGPRRPRVRRDRRRRRARRALRRRARPRRPHRAGDGRPRSSVPLVHTLHGPFTEDACRFYAQHGPKACIVGISQAQLDSAPAGDGRRPRGPQPDRHRRVAVQRRQGRLHALDRPDVARQGTAPRDRRGARGRRAARARRARPARSGAVLRRGGRAAGSATGSSTSARPTRTASASSTAAPARC